MVTIEEDKRRYATHLFPHWKSLLQDIKRLETIIRPFRERGGRVAFVRLPSTGDRWRLEQSYSPKNLNWDRFAEATSSVCIHFADVPEMKRLSCPDGSHIDERDAPGFSRSLVKELVRRAAVPPEWVDISQLQGL